MPSRRVIPMGLITNQQADVHTRYIPGSGVGATSISVRRAKKIRANDARYPGEGNNKIGCACNFTKNQ